MYGLMFVMCQLGAEVKVEACTLQIKGSPIETIEECENDLIENGTVWAMSRGYIIHEFHCVPLRVFDERG